MAKTIFSCLLIAFLSAFSYNKSTTGISEKSLQTNFCGPYIYFSNTSYASDANLWKVIFTDVNNGDRYEYEPALSPGWPDYVVPPSFVGTFNIEVWYYTEHPTDFGYVRLIQNDVVTNCVHPHYGTNVISFSNVYISCGISIGITATDSPC